LLRHDSVHGDFDGNVVADHENNALIINGVSVYMISAAQLKILIILLTELIMLNY
jgi:glyceraldehyde 3-phosphate dehydrogenase